MFDMMKRSGVVAGSSATVLAAVLGVAGLLGGSAAVQAAPVAASQVLPRQIGYGGQLAPSVTGTFPVVVRLYNGSDTVVHEETVSVDIQQGKFVAMVGGQVDLAAVLRDARTMRVFFQGNLVDTVPVTRATAEDARANPAAFAGRHTLVIPPELRTPVAVPRALGGTCTLNSSFSFLGAGAWSVNVPSCSSGVMVSSGILPIPMSSITLQAFIPAGALNDWSINFTLSTSASVNLFGICCP